MNLKDLSEKAVNIRQKYDALNIKSGNRKWVTLNFAQGFVGDVGDLMKLVMAKEGLRKIDDVDEKLAHELSDCLWSILVLADKYNIDLEKDFGKTMAELENKIDSKLGK